MGYDGVFGLGFRVMRKMLWAFGWEMEEYIKTNGFCNDYELLLCNRMTVDVPPDWLIRHLVTCNYAWERVRPSI
jgi:hypothetical protein